MTCHPSIAVTGGAATSAAAELKHSAEKSRFKDIPHLRPIEFDSFLL